VRAILGEKGNMPPITIFPEGCTTNGESVIQFKKGAFASLRAVKPFSGKTRSLSKISPNDGGGLGFFSFLAVAAQSLCWTYTL
jgi:hypothetical protein